MFFQSIINQLALNPKKLFLIDGLGAILSAFSLGIVLVRFEHYVGMPQNVLYFLSIAACFFAVYSFFCYFRTPKNWQPFLKAIAIVNFIYCCLTISLVFYFRDQLTHLGLIYFLFEVFVIIGLVGIELKMVATH